MKATTGKPEKISGRSAAKEVARMFSGDMDDITAQSIQQRRLDDPDYQRDFLDTVTVVAEMEKLSDHPDVVKMLKQYTTAPPQRNKGGYWSKTAIIAGVALLAVLGWGLISHIPAPS
ncbi:MAG: hypothetical protein OIF34_11945, partial [Porticoccaceae bacterium]|nr:hypothetical protein [Porticoccaceae bacterium]